MKIALDTARGLEHLHEHCNPPIIHTYLKSYNILFDSDFSAKVSSGNRIKGKLMEKSDVYALEYYCLSFCWEGGQIENMAPFQCQSIITWAIPQLIDRSNLPTSIDPVIKNTMDLKHW